MIDQGSVALLIMPSVPNPKGGIYLPDTETARKLNNSLHQQRAKVVGPAPDPVGVFPGFVYYYVKMMTGPEKGKTIMADKDWIFVVAYPCDCSTQTLMVRGCQNSLHI